MIGLNIGSGQRRFGKGWINLDLTVRPPEQVPDVQADAFALPLQSDFVTCVCLHHIYEHAGLNEGIGMIKEAHRVLRMQGSLLVFVPDAYELALAYAQHKISDFIFSINMMGAFQGHEVDRHRWAWCARSLTEHLEALALWRRVKPFDWRPIEEADIAKDWYICGLECIK